MSLFLKLYICLRGRCIGVDTYGHRYFIKRGDNPNHPRKRWILYKKGADPTTIPIMWYRWLHCMTNDLPLKTVDTLSFVKERGPNLTGTCLAYDPYHGPLKHVVQEDYERWHP